MDISLIVKITGRAWALKILALMDQGVPGRQATLLARSGAGRSAFVQSLQHLVSLGLMERNPGHGHPLRPEYRLTEIGKSVAAMATAIDKAVTDPPELILLRRAWTVPVLAVSKQPVHFSEIKNALLPITDRALSKTLQHLQAQHWIERRISPDDRPPRPLYQAASSGIQISEAVAQLL
ncbi:MAG: winged helix-turn-helix transcriptional regulator [Pseudomonadota bacterium]